MKKTLKSILAITLALILSFGSLTAFAATEDTLQWYFGDVITEYTWQGELTEGSHKVTCKTDEMTFLSYKLNAKDGFYLLSFSYPMDTGYIDWVGIPEEVTDGVAYDFTLPVYVYASDTADDDRVIYDMIFKLDAGETIVGVDAFVSEENADLSLFVEYLGESVTDFDIISKELISGYDIYLGDSEGWLYTDLTVNFSGGKTKVLKYCETKFKCDVIKKGENVLTVKFGDLEKDFTVTVNSIDYYIKSAELSNADKYTEVFIDYNGDYWYYPVTDDYVTVTFTDSTQQDVFIDYGYGRVELPNGKDYPVFIYSDSDYNDNYYLCISICDDIVKKYECTATKCDIIENGGILIEENKSEFVNFFSDLYWGLDDALMFDTVTEIFRSLFGTSFDTLIGAANLFSGLFENIVTFIKFYLVG